MNIRVIFWVRSINTKVRIGTSISQSKGWKVVVGIRDRSVPKKVISGRVLSASSANFST